MNSFYGGKQGRTYNIVYTYSSVAEMCDAFKDGGSYIDVNYGEYVLIDTVSTTGRSSDENGLLFRRGFDYSEEAKDKPLRTALAYNPNGNFDKDAYQIAWKNWVTNVGCGAEYVGQIVGPEGRTPEITIEDWDTFESQIGESGFGGHSIITMDSPGIIFKYIKTEDSTIDPNKTYYRYIDQTLEYIKILTPSIDHIQYYYERIIDYNDEIDAGYINLIDANGDITGGYISFDIPTPVFNFTAQSVDAYGDNELTQWNIEHTENGTYTIDSTYDSQNNKWKYENLIHVEPQSKDHPFFYNFDIAIPNGIHGQNIESIGIETGTETGASKDGFDNNIVAEDNYFTYTVKNFDGSAAGASTAHLGRWPYRVIDHIESVENNRSVSNWAAQQSFSIGDLISLNNKYFICIKAGITGESIPSEFLNPVVNTEILDNTVIWRVIDLSTTAAAGLLTVDYKAGSSDTIDFKQIDHIFIDSSGQMYVVYSTDLTTPCPISLVDSIAAIGHPQDGQITITHKNGTVDNFGIKEVDRIDLPQDITIDQDITVYYKEYDPQDRQIDETSLTIGSLNDILDIQRLGDNILILYSDPRVRAAIPQGSTYAKSWTDWRTGLTYNNLIWYNFGQLGAQYHVDGTHSYDEIDLSADPPGNLGNGFGYTWDTQTSTYVSNNLQDKMGWIITIPTYIQGDNSEAKLIQKVYAYDYQAASTHELTYYDSNLQASTIATKWYEVTSLADAVTPPDSHMVVSEENSEGSIYHTTENLKPDGIWFVVSEGGCSHA